MRQLTFPGFLKSYVADLAGEKTDSIRQLVRLSETNHRLREPLALYALFTDRKDILMKEWSGTRLETSYKQLILRHDKASMAAALNTRDESVPIEFHKVQDAYAYTTNRAARETRKKELIRARVIDLQSKTGLTNYRIYTDISLNHGNVNAWLKNGDSSKISLELARKVLQYAESYPTQHP